MDRNPGKRYILSKPPAGMFHKTHMELKLTSKHPNIGGGREEGKKRRKENRRRRRQKQREKEKTQKTQKNQKTPLWGQKHKKTNNTVINYNNTQQ